ncbi:MAG: DUF362 domain-containing protein [Desulfobacteraceae bacterium]|nr:DUF362 domain-containing protein [Desulfobacteraceae bacterium]
MMKIDLPVTRRTALNWLCKISGFLAFSTLEAWPFKNPATARAEQAKNGFLVEGSGKTEGYSVRELTRKVFESAGGIGRFISRGDVVAIKPNISWASPPHLAATTNPEVLGAVIELCQEAGAKKVRIVDHTIHDARRCFALTGAGMVAKKTNADLVYPRQSLMKKMRIHGQRLDVWPVFIPIIEADKVINLPIAKRHSLSVVTLGMKSWFGGVGGSRWSLHQDINVSIVDLAQFFKPTITLIDAIRIMIKNGPSGGSPSDVEIRNKLILSNDPVASDARAAMLFDLDPETLYFISLAQKWGLGTYDFTKLKQKKVTL